MSNMTLEGFNNSLQENRSQDMLVDFCRKHVLHGVPHVFDARENDYYDFRKKIAENFDINFHEVYITGSGKLGFSPFKNKIFDLDSDIDVAIISNDLFERLMWEINKFQLDLRLSRTTFDVHELKKYHDFLEYIAMGWLRPDKLPTSVKIKKIKNEWFDFFRDLSYGKSEVGNYKVAAGVFKSYQHFESYNISGFKVLQDKLKLQGNQL